MKNNLFNNIASIIYDLDTSQESNLFDLRISCQDESFFWSRFLVASSSKFMRQVLSETEEFSLCLPAFEKDTVLSTLCNLILCQEPVNADLVKLLVIDDVQKPEHPVIERDGKLFKCPNEGCSLTFQRLLHFQRHVASHKKETQYICDQCGKVFYHNDNLKLHMRYHQDLLTTHSCSLCPQQFNGRRALNSHMDDVHAPQIQCPLCNQSVKKKLLLRHLRSKHLKSGEKSSLKNTLALLKIEENVKDNKKNSNQPRESNQNAVEALIESQKNRVQCPDCPKTFANPYIAKYHHEKVHLKLKGDNVLSCSVCEKKFVGPPSRLSRHMREVHAENRFECPECGHFFPVKASLERHLSTVHHPLKYDCPYCPVQVVHITAHLSTAHGLSKTEARTLSSELSGKSAARTHLPFDKD